MRRNRSSRAKEKKMKWKEDLKKLSEKKALVTAANEATDHLTCLKAFQNFNRNGLDLVIECKKFADADPEDVQSAFNLTKNNMEDLYNASSWGWHEKDKFTEMSEECSWYLFVKDSTGHIVAISHFRFDFEDEDEVLYCYELQLEESVRGKGLGKFMMQILELICFRTQMKKVMLTVFKRNDAALKFYNKLKYTVDETSPRFFDSLHPELYDYEILSKVFKKE